MLALNLSRNDSFFLALPNLGNKVLSLCSKRYGRQRRVYAQSFCDSALACGVPATNNNELGSVEVKIGIYVVSVRLNSQLVNAHLLPFSC
jgi:hypothetical protein